MYQDKFVGVVKSQGRILREKNGIITLPFNTEYTILLKNLNSRSVQVNLSIDGNDVLNKKHLLIKPNSDLEIEGFLKGTTAKKRFKFINKTPQISEYRGDNIDDGIIRIEFVFEREISNECWYMYNTTGYRFEKYDPIPYVVSCAVNTIDHNAYYNTRTTKLASTNITQDLSCTNFCSNSAQDSFSKLNEEVEPLEDEGITVKGSDCNQKFTKGDIGVLENNKSVIILRLRGVDNKDNEIKEVVTVKTKLKCETCGAISRSSSNFCHICGTSL